MNTRLCESISIAAPAAVVFSAATDWNGQGEWMFLTKTRATRGTGRSTGDEISAKTGIGPLSFIDTMTITEWAPPHRCRVRHTGKVVRGTALFEVEDMPDGSSVFTWSEELELPLGRLGVLLFVATRRLSAHFLRNSLQRFAEWAAARL